MAVRRRTLSPLAREAASRPGLRAFFRIAEMWGLTVNEQIRILGSPARSTYFKWKKDGADTIPRDALERISYVLGIYRNLQVLLPTESAADAWIRRPNPAAPFGGKSPLERMMAGRVADLFAVRQYLDAQREGWY